MRRFLYLSVVLTSSFAVLGGCGDGDTPSKPEVPDAHADEGGAGGAGGDATTGGTEEDTGGTSSSAGAGGGSTEYRVIDSFDYSERPESATAFDGTSIAGATVEWVSDAGGPDDGALEFSGTFTGEDAESIYAGHLFDPTRDWSGAEQLSIRVRILEGSVGTYALFLTTEGFVWTASDPVSITELGDGWVTLTWDISGIDDLEHVQTVGLQWSAGADGSTESVLFQLDSLIVTAGKEPAGGTGGGGGEGGSTGGTSGTSANTGGTSSVTSVIESLDYDTEPADATAFEGISIEGAAVEWVSDAGDPDNGALEFSGTFTGDASQSFYAGHAFSPGKDWAGAEELTVRVRVLQGSEGTYSLFIATGDTFEWNTTKPASIASLGNDWVTLTWDISDIENLADVRRVGLVWSTSAAGSDESVLFQLDTFTITGSGETGTGGAGGAGGATSTAGAGGTAGSTGGPTVIASFTFDTSTESFDVNPSMTTNVDTPMVARVEDDGDPDFGALRVNGVFNNADAEGSLGIVRFLDHADWSGAQQLSVRVKVVVGTIGAVSLNLNTTDAYTYNALDPSVGVTDLGNDWYTLTWNISGIENLDDVTAIGFQWWVPGSTEGVMFMLDTFTVTGSTNTGAGGSGGGSGTGGDSATSGGSTAAGTGGTSGPSVIASFTFDTSTESFDVNPSMTTNVDTPMVARVEDDGDPDFGALRVNGMFDNADAEGSLGIVRFLDHADWSGAQQLSVRVKVVVGTIGAVSLNLNTTDAYTYNALDPSVGVTDLGNDWYTLTWDISDLENLDDVTAIGFQWWVPGSTEGVMFMLDTFTVTGSTNTGAGGSGGGSGTGGDSATGGAGGAGGAGGSDPVIASFGFDSGVDGFDINPDMTSNAIYTFVTQSSGALSVVGTFTDEANAGSVGIVRYLDHADWAGAAMFTANVRVMNGTIGAVSLNLNTTDAYTYNTMDAGVGLETLGGDWYTLFWDISGVANLNDVTAIGLQWWVPGSTETITLEVDNFTIVGP